MSVVDQKTSIKGGEFLVRDAKPSEVFIPENFSEEQQMMGEACEDFVYSEIIPHAERIDKLETGLAPSILEKAGELGLLGVTVPEEYGGLGMNFNTSMLMADKMGASGAFSTTFSVQTTIGMLPIQYYGNAAQKQKYLPGIASGEIKSCYCLTEPDAGSDANSSKSRAVLNEAGTHYLLSGQKMWITNSGFADIFIVFAKIDDDRNLSAFIVEKAFGNITLGDEEKKLGIKGSSTRQVFFNETPVPVENLLSERGNGFKIALNILNTGRIKLGVAVVGACKKIITDAVVFSNERKQFKQKISSFGAIQYKLAEMAARTFATESASYRAGQDIEDKIKELESLGMSKEEAILKGVEQFAMECAIIKVHGGEVLAYVADEGVQIYGGMGFSADAPMERAFRDARIMKIYEGTNEINRILMVNMIFKRSIQGELSVLDAAKEVLASMLGGEGAVDDPVQTSEKKALYHMKKAALFVLGALNEHVGPNVRHEQEILMHIADMIIEIYAAEAALLRSEKLAEAKGSEAVQTQVDLARMYVCEAVEKVGTSGRKALFSFIPEDSLSQYLAAFQKVTKPLHLNPKETRRAIAQKLIEANAYNM